ncbi:MAG: serpin family protein [Clostridiales bacterium]|nr:serpin family protein [Clostridiales bacterium]
MRKKIIILLVMALFTASCQFDKGAKEGGKVLPEATKEETEQIQKDMDVTKAMDTLSKGVNQFSYALYDGLENGKNLCISPYSIVSALSMLDNGADGNTKKEIEKALGIEDITVQNQVLQKYADIQKQKGIKFYWANSVWVSKEVLLEDNSEKDFFQPLQQFYHADKHYQPLDTVDTMNQVNNWVSKETKGMLDNLLLEPLNPETKILLLNALYFQGEWKDSFVNEGDKMQFHGSKGETMVPKMQLDDISLKYIKKYGLKGVEIPYKDDAFAMDVFLPEQEEASAIFIFQDLKQEEKNNLFEEFEKVEKQQIQMVIMPKFTTEYSVDSNQLIDVLKGMGITDAFSDEKADFSKISTSFSYYVNKILHKTKIEVQEKGTEAAAVTAVIMTNGCGVLAEDELIFLVNQPFLYAIRDTETGMILFLGSVQDFDVQSFPGHTIEEK